MALEVNISKSQDEMDEQFINEYAAAHKSGDFKSFAEDWGMSEEDAHSYASDFPVLEELYEEEIVSEGIDLSMPEDGKFAELTDEQIDNIQNFIPAARLGKVVKAGKSMFGDAMNKLFSSKALKTNQLTKGGKVGQRIEPGTISKNVAGTGLKPSVKQGTVDRYNKMADAVKTKRAVELGTAGTAATLIGLSGGDDGEIVTGHPPVNDPYEKPKTQSRNLKGNRDEEGNLKDAIRFTHANGSYAFAEPGSDLADELMAEEYFAGDIAGQNAGKSQSNTGSDWANAEIDDEIGVEEPEGDDMPEYKDNVPETMGNQFGYHKREGQNFWTVNNDDPYWDTHVMGTGDAWSDADAKEEVQELDWSGWFK